ncbi:Receptor-like protein EIX1 [Sesamum alatum]|uniref:Receptor-like protein EIX1 n=1 Tax=Sesamum alatum TaxID=300844 RepID=A0AAE2CR45_9LAMI|nr:Receptor-like protein EIX1 [Sesamum alatum]
MKCFHILLLVVVTTLRPILAHSSKVNNTNTIRCLEKERRALLDIKGNLVDTHGRLSSWGDQENKRDCCKWKGVHCHNQSNHVTQLDLVYYLLRGKISTSLLELQHIRYLDLSENDFEYAPVPEFIGSLTKLRYLKLSNSNFSGPIPHQIGNLVSLEYLDLSRNDLKGGIPKQFGNLSNLINLNVNENNLSGDIHELMSNLFGPIEKKLENLDLSMNGISGLFPNMSRFSSLSTLDLHGNQLSGPIREDYLRLPNLTSLELSSNRIIGPVPDLSVSSSLEYLYLSNNMFNGTLTQSIARLSQLLELDLSKNKFLEVDFSRDWTPDFILEYLDLSFCKLGKYFPTWLKTQTELLFIDISGTGISDTISSWFGSIPSTLMYLNASNNQMHGSFPNFSFSSGHPLLPYLGSYRRVLDLSRNKISGSVNFLCDITDWQLLDLSDNLFSGQIPDCFANFEMLRHVNLANNHLSGEIPYSFGSLSALTLLHLRNNSLSGGLPTSMRNCTSLEMIDVGDNRLTGKIPAWIGDSFSEVRILILSSNGFHGSMPLNLCRLANLQILDISSNKMSGAIPECLQDFIAMTEKQNPYPFWGPKETFPVTQMLENAYLMWKGKEVRYINYVGLVKLIDFSNNELVGKIPSNVTKLVGLVGLNISRNNLVGPIPSDTGDLQFLNFLDLSRNRLSGSIPSSLCDLSHLGLLDLSYNNLSGRIPLSNQGLTFDESTFEGNVGLRGLPLNKSCPGDKSHQGPNSRVDGSDVETGDEFEDARFITDGFYIPLGLGFVVGFWGIFGTILLNKTFRYVFFESWNTINDLVFVKTELTKARLRRYFQNQ